MMHPSRYNFILNDNKNNIYIYNSFSNGLARINTSTANFLSNSGCFDESVLSEDILNILKRGGFIIDFGRDELKELKIRNRSARFSDTSLGLTIAPTTSCNFRCSYCFQRESADQMTEDTITNIYSFVLNNLSDKADFGVCWYGGEPLLAIKTIERLSKWFMRLCELSKISYEADIISNGYLMTKKNAQLLSELQVRFWQVTLDGPATIHDSRRKLANGEPTFQMILNNIIESYEYFNKVAIRINIDKRNKNHVHELIDILAESGLKNKVDIYFGKVEAFGACKDAASCCFNEIEFAESEINLYKELIEKGFKVNKRPRLISAYCLADRINSYVITPNGLLTKCWNIIGSNEEHIGSVMDEELNINYTKWIGYDPFDDSECIRCRHLPLCMGGCPHDAVIEKKKSCVTIRYNLEEILRLRLMEV